MFSDILITKEFEGKILKDYLLKYLKISRRGLIALKTSQGIIVNGVIEKVNITLKYNDILSLRFPDNLNENIEEEDIKLDILYEDEWIIILNKPAGMPVHPCHNYQSGTLANALIHKYQKNGERAGIHAITRLDRGTSGVTVFAKHPHVQNLFSKYEYKKEFKKKYLALVEGEICPPEGIIDLPIGRLEEGKIPRGVIPNGAPSITGYKVKKSNPNISLIEVDLFTGRTHQIRVHFSHLGHPLLGDTMYGGQMDLIGRQALHSFQISFVHPIKNILIEVESKMPDDMETIVNSLFHYL